MANDPTTRNLPAKPSKASLAAPTIDRETAMALDVAANMAKAEYAGGPMIVIGGLPASIRSPLERRADVLARSLVPMDATQQAGAAGAISGMLGVFGGGAVGDPKAVVSKYIEVVADLPLWAVRDACRMLERGEVEDVSLDFRPAAPRLRQVARKLMEPGQVELYRIRKLLAAEVVPEPDPEMKRRVGDLLAGLGDALRMGPKREDSDKAVKLGQEAAE